MKIKYFFDNCHSALDSLIASLETSPTDNIRLSRYPDCIILSTMLDRVAKDTSPMDLKNQNRAIKEYLNDLCVELIDQKNPYFQDEINSFYFLSIDPLRLCAEDSCTTEYLIAALKILKQHLNQTFIQLTQGWQVSKDADDIFNVVNTCCGFNWELFDLFSTITREYSLAVAENPFTLITAKFSLAHFFDIYVELGLTLNIQQQLSTSVKNLASAYLECANPKASTLAHLLISLLEKLPSEELCQRLRAFIDRNNDDSLTAIITALRNITETYSVSVVMLKKCQGTIKPVAEMGNKKNITQFLTSIEKQFEPLKLVLEAHMPQTLQDECKTCTERLAELRKLLRNCTPILYPYALETETFFSTHIMNLPYYLQPLKAIKTFLQAHQLTPQLAQSVAEVLIVIDFSEFQAIFKQLANNNFHHSVITLAELLFDIFELMRSDLKESKDYRLTSMIQSYKGTFFNACTVAGYFEKGLYWLNYLEKVTIGYDGKHLYNYFFHVGEIAIVRSNIEHRCGNFDAAITLLHQAKIASESAPVEYAKLATEKTLLEFLKGLCVYRQHLSSSFHLLGLEIAKRGAYDQANSLYDIALQLGEHKGLEQAFGQVKVQQPKFRKLALQWQYVDVVFIDCSKKLLNAKFWNSMIQSLTTPTPKKQAVFPRQDIAILRNAEAINPDLIKYRCLQDYSLDTMYEIHHDNYHKNLTALLKFMDEISDPNLHDHIRKLIAQMHIGIAIVVWNSHGQNEALHYIQKAEEQVDLFTAKESAAYLEVITEIRNFKSLFTCYLLEAEFTRLKARLSEGSFNTANCEDTQAYDNYLKLSEMHQQISTYIKWPAKINKEIPEVLFSIMQLRCQIAFEIFNQTLYFTNEHDQHPLTKNAVIALFGQLAQLCKDHHFKMPSALKSMHHLIDALEFKDQHPTKALSSLTRAEEFIKTNKNLLLKINIQLLKITQLLKSAFLEAHTQLTGCYNLIKAELACAHLVAKQQLHMIFNNIIAVCYRGPLEGILSKTDYAPQQLIALQNFFAARLQLIQTMKEYCPEKVNDELHDCMSDAEEIGDHIRYQQQPAHGEAILAKLMQTQSPQSESRLARAQRLGFFSVKASPAERIDEESDEDKFLFIPVQIDWDAK